jgi:hypothetical protein
MVEKWMRRDKEITGEGYARRECKKSIGWTIIKSERSRREMRS